MRWHEETPEDFPDTLEEMALRHGIGFSIVQESKRWSWRVVHYETGMANSGITTRHGWARDEVFWAVFRITRRIREAYYHKAEIAERRWTAIRAAWARGERSPEMLVAPKSGVFPKGKGT